MRDVGSLDLMLTPDEAATMLGVARSTIVRWARLRTIDAVKYGRFWRIPASTLVHPRMKQEP